MNRYADPTACPGCRAPIEYGAPTCPSCGLTLTGLTAQQLFSTLQHADYLVGVLRGAPVGAAAAATRPAGPEVTGLPGGLMGPPLEPGQSRAVGSLSSASVPKILLGLGATCLLVAALVFMAVAWASLGVGARTGVLVGLTATAAGLCFWVSGRGLRAGAESFAAVFLGFLALDFGGARSAGWLDALSADGFLILLGSVLAVVGAATRVLAQQRPVRQLAAAEVGAAIGLLVAVSGWVAQQTASGELAGVLIGLAVAYTSRRARLVVLAVGALATAGLWWLALVAEGLSREYDAPTTAALLGRLEAWPLAAAVVVATALAGVTRLPLPVRLLAAGAGTTVVALGLLVPTHDDSATTFAVVGLLALGAAVAGTLLAPGRWGWAGLGAMAVTGVSVGTVTAALLVQAADRLAAEPWSEEITDRLSGPDPFASPLVVVPALPLGLGIVAGVLRLLGVAPAPRTWLVPGVAVGVVGLGSTLALYDNPRWPVVAALAAGAVVAWLLGRSTTSGAVAVTVLAAGAVATASPSDWLTAGALAVAAGLAFAIDYADRAPARLAAAAASVVLTAGLLWTGGHLALMPVVWLPVLVIATLGAMCLARPVPAYELAAAPTVVLALAAAQPSPSWLAFHLTLAGVLVSASGLYQRRSELGWVGSGLLFVAMWLRLADIGVTTVEAYTLPLAAALTGFGLYRMYRDEGAGTLSTLTAGLSLAVVPSLLVAFTDPVSPRALLLGLGCLAMLAAGAVLHWSAPVLVGAGTGLLLVLWEAGYAQMLPQWVTIGLVGTLLTVVGVTWEQRLRELRLAMGYVRSLR